MSEVKTFRVTGEINKQKFFIPMAFSKEIRAAKMEHAIERIYAEMGSRHRAKRNQITIIRVEEVQPEKAG
jgi:ribosomal protein L20A (L18A)